MPLLSQKGGLGREGKEDGAECRGAVPGAQEGLVVTSMGNCKQPAGGS